MKIFFLTIFLNISLVLNCQDNAAEYLAVFGKAFSDLREKTWEYTCAAAHARSAKKIEKKRKQLVLAGQDAMRRIGRLNAFEGSMRLRDSALSYLRLNYAVLNEDFSKIVDLETIADQSYDAMEAYMLAREKANARLKMAGLMIDQEYAAFAATHQVSVATKSDQVAKNLELAAEVYKHYHEVYLVFFRSYKQEAYLLDAMSNFDVNATEQNRTALKKTSDSGLVTLSRIQNYNHDSSLVHACRNLLQFYREESLLKDGIVSNYQVAFDNFQKLKVLSDTIKKFI